MKQNFKIEILSFFEREPKVYTAIIKFLEGADEMGGDYIDYGGTYIDLETQSRWTIIAMKAFLGAQADAKKIRMIGLRPMEGEGKPYQGMVVEQVK